MTACLPLLLLLFAGDVPEKPAGTLRVATFNASLNRDRPGGLIADLSKPNDPQARNVAEIIQRVAPDVVLVNEFDYDPKGRAAELFQANYLSRGQNGAEPIIYPHRFSDQVNTGVASGHDLNHDGQVVQEPGTRGYGEDALGFGLFPGQYGMIVYSRFPIDRPAIQRFTEVLWKDMPDAMLPRNPDGSTWYPAGSLDVLRVSSKGHWAVPIKVGKGAPLTLLVSHPTPPAFDGPEDRNGRRNHDEIRLWADFLTGGELARYLGPYESPGSFVILGDQNADPQDGGSVLNAIGQLLDHPRVNASFVPQSDGAEEAARLQKGANANHKSDPRTDTSDFADRTVGNLRVDYVLPSKDLKVVDGGVFWPPTSDPLARLVTMTPAVASSDHRLVWLDLKVPGENR